jgi:hypothetical protein
MKPEFSSGDLIVVSKRNLNKLAAGDNINFYSNDPLVYREIVKYQIVLETMY